MKQRNNWIWQDYKTLASTNDKAKELVIAMQRNCIVSSILQTDGRGRRGRNWISQEGNLFASFALKIALTDISKIALLSAVAVFKTIEHFVKNQSIKIKWPNDVLVNDAKISGILFEKADDNFWVMGIGINVVSSPENSSTDYKTTSINSYRTSINRFDVLYHFVKVFDELLNTYCQKGFAHIKQTWLDNAYCLGNCISIKQEKNVLTGVFETIDDNGALLLKTEDGIKTILVGDLFINKG